MLQIISHRGFWNNCIKKNSIEAFNNSFKNGFGIETDLRDLNGSIVISHDMPKLIEDNISFDQLLRIYKKSNLKNYLALNVKSDGIFKLAKELILKHKIDNYFFFDMSIPDHLNYIKEDLNTFSRLSEFEKLPVFLENISGIWLDSFNEIWYDEELISFYLNHNKKVCIVSPELHNRPHLDFWRLLKTYKIHLNQNVLLCTDIPIDAKIFFNEQ